MAKRTAHIIAGFAPGPAKRNEVGMYDDFSDRLAELGEPVAEFTVPRYRWLRNLLLAPALIALGLFLLAGPWLVVGRPAPTFVKLVFLGVFLTVAGVILGVRALRNRGTCVLVYPEGLVHIRGGQAVAFCWDEVEAVWRKRAENHWSRLARGSLLYTVRRTDGREIHFTDFLNDLERLGGIIQRETLGHLLLEAQKGLEAGEVLEFGPLRLDRDAIVRSRDTLPWEQVRGIEFNGDEMAVLREGKRPTWCIVSLGDVPNYHVLLELVRSRRGGEK